MAKPELSVAIQDYLKEIYKLQASGQRATTTAIAREMGVAPSSATSMVKKLAALGLARVDGDERAVARHLAERGERLVYSPRPGELGHLLPREQIVDLEPWRPALGETLGGTVGPDRPEPWRHAVRLADDIAWYHASNATVTVVTDARPDWPSRS